MTIVKKLTYIISLFILLSISSFAQDEKPLRVCLVSGTEEYNSDKSLSHYKDYLESKFNIHCIMLSRIGFTDLPGLGALEDCDVALFFTRRLRIPEEQLQRVKDYCLAGKPIVAVRTASHGFQHWLEFDKKILGGNYDGHHGNEWTQTAQVVEGAEEHPIMQGVDRIVSPYSLYETSPIADDCNLLMSSTIPNQPPEPAAWTREVNGGRVFYTQLGGVSDFENDSFLRMLTQALYWTSERDIPEWPAPEVKPRPKPKGNMVMTLRSRVNAFKGTDDYQEVDFIESLPADETAFIVCDMWDKHWCKGAVQRVNEMVPQMAKVLKAAQERGILVAHCPSSTLDFYENHPARLRALEASRVDPEVEKDIPSHPLPIDDSDGGCDTGQQVQYRAWSRQHAGLPISEYDIISDNGREVYSVFHEEGIKNVIFMGVHTNMCVLNRSFAIRQMSKWGMRCILVRDLTDTMYDPDDPPHVPHSKGTELVVEHIEKYWAPTVTSEGLLRAIGRMQ